MSEKTDLARPLALGFIAGMIVAVLALEYYGYLQHSKPADAALVAEFRLLDLRLEQEIKISEKPSGKVAFCSKGYLLLRPDNGKDIAGILVDSKNRGIQCQMN